jgi:hypothetical protein
VFLTLAQAKAQKPTTPAHTVDAWSYTVRLQSTTAGISLSKETWQGTVTTVATASRESFDFDSLSRNGIPRRSQMGVGRILIITQSGKDTIVTLLDTTQHTYRRFPNGLAGVVYEKTGLIYQPDSSAPPTETIEIDSLGIGPVIQSHHTVHYRQVMHITVPYNMPGLPDFVRKDADTVDYYIAPDLNDPALQPDELFVTTLDLDSVSRTAAKKLPRGFPLHIEYRAVMTFSHVTTTISASADVDKISHRPVDTALFTTPPSYTLVADSASQPTIHTPGANGANRTP